ncbi:unnamed protein product [Thelazia callipaeda]|uniref:Separase n=1 Tax=Thelazia callipaeda TaxID=103827 RepID=A0A0N5CWQ1_THECL|nr:unnamed protein product [Thelazia callipaeda]
MGERSETEKSISDEVKKSIKRSEKSEDLSYPVFLEQPIVCDGTCELCQELSELRNSEEPILSEHEVDEEDIEVKSARTVAFKCCLFAEEMARFENWGAAYQYYLRGCKILKMHGDAGNSFAFDMPDFRVYIYRCILCLYQHFMQNENSNSLKLAIDIVCSMSNIDHIHPVWQELMGLLLYEYQKYYCGAVKSFLAFVFIGGFRPNNLKPFHSQIFADCCFKMFEQQDKSYEKVDKNPFITSDWINLWAICPSDDVILEDFMSVYLESNKPGGVCSIIASEYRKALEAMAVGCHSTVITTLKDAHEIKKRPYRAEAYLLEALIYSQISDAEVIDCLDKFVIYWEFDQYHVSTSRRKKIFMRYLSLARSIRKDPFYLLKAYTAVEIEAAEAMMRKSGWAMLRLKECINEIDVSNQCQKEHRIFAQWCLCSAYYVIGRLDKVVIHGRKLGKYLIFPGFISSLLIELEFEKQSRKCNSKLNDLEERINELLKRDPENFRLHLILTEYHLQRMNLQKAVESGNNVLKFWPDHLTRLVPRLLRNILMINCVNEAVAYASKVSGSSFTQYSQINGRSKKL